MIHHISLPAADTRKVANVLAELFDGTVTDFSPTENAYMVWFGDEYGSAIDCLLYTSPSPRDATLSRMPSSA